MVWTRSSAFCAQQITALAVCVGLACVFADVRTASAQTGECRLAAEATSVTLGQSFRIEATCYAEGAEAGMPELALPDFEVLTRQTDRPGQLVFGLGGRQQVIQSTTRLTLLVRPRREGRFEVGPAATTVAGQRVASGTLSISVGGSISAPGQPGQLMNPGQPQANGPAGGPPSGPLDGAVYDDQAFLRTVVDRHEAFLGQQVTVTLYLYVRSLATQPQITQQPATDGFWVHELLDRNAPPDAVMQRVGTTGFRVYTLRRFAAFPLREGELSIGAMQMQVPVGNPLDMIFGGAQSALTRTSVPVTITVRPASEGAAQGLPVHVGALHAEAALDRAQVPTGDAVTLDLHLSGLGQIDAITAPRLAVPGLRVLQPEVQQRTTVEHERVGGDRRIRWLIVPEQPGTYTLGPFRWAVFDPDAGSWSVVETPALTLLAAGNPTASTEPRAPTDTPTRVQTPSEEETAAFGPVRTSSAFVRRGVRFAATPWFALALALGPLALLVTGLVALGRRGSSRRAEAGAPDRALREARRRLDEAAAAIVAKDTRGFYGAITQALKQGLEARLGRAIGSLTHAELRRVLVERGMHEALANKIKEELEGAEMARFSAAGGEEREMRAALERTRALFTEAQRFNPREEEA